MSKADREAPIAVLVEGDRFGLWTVVDVSRGARYITCRCECSRESTVATFDLKHGKSRGCRYCMNARATHGLTRSSSGAKTPEYRAWQAMVARCTRPNHESYADYGGRGIRVCERWLSDYAAFLIDMGRRPSPRHSIDRYPDNDGNYEPGNCRWATSRQQARNKRDTIMLNGRPLVDAAEDAGLKMVTVRGRVYSGWPENLWLAPLGTRRP